MVTLKDLVTKMEAPYIYEYNVYAAKNALPIYFVHNGTVGDMDNHVLHMHDSMELYFFIAGDHKYVVDNSIYDLSYGDIIQIKKIALAKSMLIAGSNVTETCFACGFNDCSYFIRIFRKYAGMTPAAYRRMNCNT